MSQLIQIRCDLCGKVLDSIDIEQKSQIITFGKPKKYSKHSLSFKFEGVVKNGDICFNCGKKVQDFIHEIKSKR